MKKSSWKNDNCYVKRASKQFDEEIADLLDSNEKNPHEKMISSSRSLDIKQ